MNEWKYFNNLQYSPPNSTYSRVRAQHLQLSKYTLSQNLPYLSPTCTLQYMLYCTAPPRPPRRNAPQIKRKFPASNPNIIIPDSPSTLHTNQSIISTHPIHPTGQSFTAIPDPTDRPTDPTERNPIQSNPIQLNVSWPQRQQGYQSHLNRKTHTYTQPYLFTYCTSPPFLRRLHSTF